MSLGSMCLCSGGLRVVWGILRMLLSCLSSFPEWGNKYSSRGVNWNY